MAAITPRRSLRIPHQHTPKMSERKKGLFQSDSEASRDSMTKHRELTVVDSESELEDCDLGIMGALDSSSSDENSQDVPKTPVSAWRATRSQTNKLLKECNDLKNFIKSPFTLKKYQTKYTVQEKGSVSTPGTPQIHKHQKTPSSTHSCASAHTFSSTSSRARKSLASLIADTESCSSSLKDLNFDTDSASDSKENTPTKLRRSRRNKMTPKLSFKGILSEQKRNVTVTPVKKQVVTLTQLDLNKMISPTQMLKTPHNTLEAENTSPPKLSHRRAIYIDESPESANESEKNNKRLNYDSKNDIEASSKAKHPRLENTTFKSKARLSLFDLKEILSTKSFYGKSNPDLNKNVTAKIYNAIETVSYRRRLFPQLTKRKRVPGQINMGVRHRIKKPKALKKGPTTALNAIKGYSAHSANLSQLNSTVSSARNDSMSEDAGMSTQNTAQELLERTDPFSSEKQTIEALLSQWEEEEVPETEISAYKPTPELACFNSAVIAETDQIFRPVTAVPVPMQNMHEEFQDSIIVELGAKQQIVVQKPTNIPPRPLAQNVLVLGQNVSQMAQHLSQMVKNVSQIAQNVTEMSQDVVMEEHKDTHGDQPGSGNGQFLPVEGGYILVAENDSAEQAQDIPDLDEIDRELQELDEKILRMAKSNNIDPGIILNSNVTPTKVPTTDGDSQTSAESNDKENDKRLFPIFSKPNPGTSSTPKASSSSITKKPLLKTGRDQYVIDAGQKHFGATQCTECGVIYQIGDPQDEHAHLVHHNASDVLKFNGFKGEYIVGRAEDARCIRIRGGETGWKKVEQLLYRVVHPQLGYGASLPGNQTHAYTAYLYVHKKQILGCMVVEPKLKAYKLIPGDPDCCSLESYPVKCGISRVWTHKNYRRRQLASRLLDCARASFLHGEGLKIEDIAFSAPTTEGKAFAKAVTGTDNFYVYLD